MFDGALNHLIHLIILVILNMNKNAFIVEE